MIRLLSIALLLLACDTIPPDELVPRSVVKVQFSQSYATGFFVDKHIVATVDHVIHNDEQEAIVHYYPEIGRVDKAAGLVVHRNAHDDFALLFVRARGTPVPVCHAHVGDHVRIYRWFKGPPEFASGRIFTKWSNHYTTTAETDFGYSGGPVVYRDCVIAMHKGKTCIGTTHAIYNDWGGVFD